MGLAPRLWTGIPLALLLVFTTGGCGASSEDRVEGGTPEGVVEVHYLGHASFLLTFDNGLTVLTDYGESRAYGLDSPIYPLGDIEPDIVTLSHDHPDHSGGALPDGPHHFLRGEGLFESQGLTITPIPTYEGGVDTPDNFSFLFAYKGLKILHLGDCQGLMSALRVEGEDRAEVGSLIGDLYPHRYDLVLLPIGFIGDILDEAAAFMRFLDAGTVIPMHYWSPADQDAFLDLLEGEEDALGRSYRPQRESGPSLTLPLDPGAGDVGLVGLQPAPPRTPGRGSV